MEQHHFDCQCSDFNHTVRFTLDPDDGEVWIDVRLNYCDPLWKRVWNAVRYVFKRPVAYGHYDVTMLREEDFGRLHQMLNRASLAAAAYRQAALKGPTEKPLLKG
jgi:hypothetical protein